MIKKIGFIALVAAALICGTWGYIYLQDLKKPALRPLDVLPDTCGILIEVRQPKAFIAQLTQGNLVWEELVKIKDVKDFNAVMTMLDSLTQDEETMDYLGHEPFYIAVYGGGASQHVLYAFNISDINDADRALGFFEKYFSAKKLGPGLYQCTFSDEGRADFFIYAGSGLIIASRNRSLLEETATGKNRRSIAANPFFATSYKTLSRDKGAGIFLHLPFFYRHNWKDLLTLSDVQYLSENDEKWITADIAVEPAEMKLQGFLPVDSARLALVMQNQDAGSLRAVLEQLPYHTFSLEALHISDYGQYCRDNYRGDKEQRRRELKPYSDSLSADAQTEIISFIGSYWARCNTLHADTLYEYGIIDVADAENAGRFLRALADSVIRTPDSAIVYSFGDKDLFPLLTARFVNDGYAFAALISEKLVFGKSMKGLREYRRGVSDKNNFLMNERAAGFLERNFNSELNYVYYTDVFRDQGRLTKLIAPEIRKKIPASLFENFDALGFSIQKYKGGLLFKAHAGFNPKSKMYQSTLWEALADTDLYKAPVPLINHRTGETELVCQDLHNDLYLLSNTGKPVWKRNVGERILGDPVQIDYFANGKLQMLFVSENLVHLVDRNGNYVEGFPVKIKAGASGPLSVFDYDGSRNYRIWLPLKNNTVVCLNNQCKLVEGFNPVNVKAPLARAIKHVLIQQKDYFILTDTLGQVYVTNRRGESRLSFANRLPAGDQPVLLDAGKDVSKTYLCFVDKESRRLHKLSLTDKMEVLTLQPEGDITGYCFDTLPETRQPVTVVVTKKQLQLYDLFGAKVHEMNLPVSGQGEGCALDYSDKKVFVTLQSEAGELLLIDLQTGEQIMNGIRLSALPASYQLIRNQGRYLVGYYRNKIFCMKP